MLLYRRRRAKQTISASTVTKKHNLLIAAISNDVFFHFPYVLCLNCEDDEIMQM